MLSERNEIFVHFQSCCLLAVFEAYLKNVIATYMFVCCCCFRVVVSIFSTFRRVKKKTKNKLTSSNKNAKDTKSIKRLLFPLIEYSCIMKLHKMNFIDTFD